LNLFAGPCTRAPGVRLEFGTAKATRPQPLRLRSRLPQLPGLDRSCVREAQGDCGCCATHH
jgi:hypothetical protein